jgi:hypothetical protein
MREPAYPIGHLPLNCGWEVLDFIIVFRIPSCLSHDHVVATQTFQKFVCDAPFDPQAHLFVNHLSPFLFMGKKDLVISFTQAPVAMGFDRFGFFCHCGD